MGKSFRNSQKVIEQGFQSKLVFFLWNKILAGNLRKRAEINEIAFNRRPP